MIPLQRQIDTIEAFFAKGVEPRPVGSAILARLKRLQDIDAVSGPTYQGEPVAYRWMSSKWHSFEYADAGDLPANAPKEIEPLYVDTKLSALIRHESALWRALLASAYIRPLGSAGIEQDTSHPNYAHLGLELWTIYPCLSDTEKVNKEKENKLGQQWLTKYAEKAMLAQREEKLGDLR